MHIDEEKKFDRRNIFLNLKSGIITQKDYDIFLSKLTDACDKIFNPDEISGDSGETELRKEDETSSKKRGIKRKIKGK